MRKMTTEQMEPAKNMQRFDGFIAVHEDGGHKHHKN